MGRCRAWQHRGQRRVPAAEVLRLLDGLAAALRSGLPTVEALVVVAATLDRVTRQALVDPVVVAARQGRSGAAVWHRLARRHADPDLAALGRAWELSERSGVPLAEAVATAAQVSRSRMAHDQRVATATAGARATSALLTVLPVGGVGVAALVGVGPGEMYATPVSLASLVLGVLLLLVGRWVVDTMVAGVRTGAA